MILIERNSANTVVLTLTERTTITNATYLFSFQSLENEYKNFIAIDTSVQTERYNKFIITEVGNGAEDLTVAEVQLLPTGFWKYTVYAQTSTTNLLPASADEIVERGKVLVQDSSTPAVTYNEPTNNEDTYIIPNE